MKTTPLPPALIVNGDIINHTKADMDTIYVCIPVRSRAEGKSLLRMRTVEQINKLITAIKADERLACPSANIMINAPLALEQLVQTTKLHALQWTLGEKLSTIPLKRRNL